VIVIDWLGKNECKSRQTRLLRSRPAQQLFEAPRFAFPNRQQAFFHFGAISDNYGTDVEIL